MQQLEVVERGDSFPPRGGVRGAPGTARRNVIAPAEMVTTSRRVGSGITAASPTYPARIAANVPAPPSSSDGTPTRITSPASPSGPTARVTARIASSAATSPPFMSHVPRPNTRPSRRSGSNGGVVQLAGSPAGTTSV